MRHRPELKKGRGRNKMEEGCRKGSECSNINVGSFFCFFLDSMFISVEDRTRRIRFSYNYSMSFTCSR